jgi:phosphatidylglycerol:prolipoprotein diacylglycerol transferase
MQGLLGPYLHRIDPVIVDVGGIHVWWYGLSYALGFLQVLWFMKRARGRLGLTSSDVYTLSIVFAVCVLAGGRAIETAFDEWPFYREHLWLVPWLWLGGMATHGLLLGAAIGVWLFSSLSGKPFMAIADELVIPGAMLMGLGRLGNFIDGQIVGYPTDVWWAVKFPDADGFRHPVVLYDGLKNLLLVPLLLVIRRVQPAQGRLAAHFVFWYAFLRIPIDLFRDYPHHRLALGTGQTLNIAMAALGAGLLVRSYLKRRPPFSAPAVGREVPASWTQRVLFAAVLLFSLMIPSNWTQDVPGRYGGRHPGLHHSTLYPAIDTRATGVR